MKVPPAVTRLEVRYGDLDPYGHVNNAVYLEFFEEIRISYWRALADLAGIEELEAGDVPGARYVIAETTVRFKAPVFLSDTLHGAASISTVGNRSYAMEFELRTGESFEAVALAAEATKPGDVVLLSPGCASFDWYRSYAERGDDFAAAVHALLETRHAN